jgi:hypothetical protein
MPPGQAAAARSDAKDRKRLPSGDIVFNRSSYFFTGKINGVDLKTFLSPAVRSRMGVGDIISMSFRN